MAVVELTSVIWTAPRAPLPCDAIQVENAASALGILRSLASDTPSPTQRSIVHKLTDDVWPFTSRSQGITVNIFDRLVSLGNFLEVDQSDSTGERATRICRNSYCTRCHTKRRSANFLVLDQ